MFPKKVTDNRKKNTKRKILESTKEKVYLRDDGKCIICWKFTNDEFHHARYGMESIYWETRNTPEELVLLCHLCHHHLHFDWWNNYREYCIEYLNKIYGK